MSVLEVKNDDDGSAIITYWRRKALKGKKKSQEGEKNIRLGSEGGKKKKTAGPRKQTGQTRIETIEKENERFRTFINKTRT